MNEYNIIPYIQGDQKCYTTVLPFHLIDKIARPLIYDHYDYEGEKKYGYQRKVNTDRVNKICKNLIENKLVSPTSIILGINESEVGSLIHKEESNFILKVSEEFDGLLRVIDGQHRLAGISKAAEVYKRFDNYMLNVILIAIKDHNRLKEVEIFKDINSLAKPIKLDLTMLAEYRYKIMERNMDIDISRHIGIQSILMLNDGDVIKNNVWNNAIKVDLSSNKVEGIIGFKSYYESIEKICDELSRDFNNEEDNFDKIIEYVNSKANILCNEILIPTWSCIREKWPKCFSKNYEFNLFEEKITHYNDNYYLQKTLGVKALHRILVDYIDETKDIQISVDKMKELILNNNLTSKDWIRGGKFKGMSSESAFKVVSSIIKENAHI